MKNYIKKIIQKSYPKKVLDLYVQARIDYFIKNKLDIEKNPQYKDALKKNFNIILWENLVANTDKTIKILDEKVKIYCYSDSLLSKLIFTDKFEEAELIFLKRFLKKGDCFIDIGSNIGLFSLIASALVGETGKVLAFEPTPKTFLRLVENINLNRFLNIEALQIAISNKNEKLEMTTSLDGYDAWNSLAKPSSGEILEKVMVDCYSLDTLIEEKKYINEASLIKIDIEGWELFALKGGEAFFLKGDAPTLLIEFTEQNAINAGVSCKDVYQYLNELGYNMYYFNKEKLILEPALLKDYYPYENLIATKNKDEVEIKLQLS